jgi:antimicrobial peptide system SdpB family protein
LDSVIPWTNVYGLARSLLALAQLLTLACNSPHILFRPIAGLHDYPPFCSETLQKMDAFCLGRSHIEIVRWFCVFGLAIIASGWRPRYTCLLHWWIAASFQLSASTLEGGDQAAQVLTMFLLPVALTDNRKWHWANSGATEVTSGLAKRLVASCGLLACRIQVAGIYFHAGMGKLKGPEWVNGTAMYYWLLHPLFGVATPFRHVATILLANSYVVATLTWGSIAVELALFSGLFATRSIRRILLVVGICFHFGIWAFMGLGTFSIVMWAAVILYLRPSDEPFKIRMPMWLATQIGRVHPSSAVVPTATAG